MSSQICLKWNSFLNNIATSFESLWEEEGLVDVTLASDGQCLTAHKVILSASSPFFKKVFQANPCQHPVIILQDVHFSELEALLIFIYKGEVNIEQKNLPALLKAAETLQIRGLSGGDVFAKESYKRLAELERSVEDELPTKEGTPKKRQKVVNKQSNNSLPESTSIHQTPPVDTVRDATVVEQIPVRDEDCPQGHLLNPLYEELEMKIEPLERSVEDAKGLQNKDALNRLDPVQTEGTQGSSERPGVTVIPEASRQVSCLSSSSLLRFPVGLGKSPARNSSVAIEEPPLGFPPYAPLDSANPDFADETVKGGGSTYLPFPCPFCDRAYTSWGFRRRHMKAVHTISPSLNCKWCLQTLPTHTAWKRHVISVHNLSDRDAHNGLLILEEAHMVLQIARPTKLDALVSIIKESSQRGNSCGDPSQTERKKETD